MKRKVKLALIVLLLIAVAAVSFGIQKLQKERTAGQSTDVVAEQVDGAGIEQTDDASCERGGESAAAGQDDESAAAAQQDTNSLPLTTIFFASDYQPEDGFDNPSATLSTIINAAKADGKNIDRVVMCGDYTNDPVFQNYQISPDDSIEEIREIVRDGCPGAGDDILFVQGNHDALSSQISSSGLHEYEDCLIYVLNTEEDFPWKQGKTMGCLAKVRRSSEEMKECFDELKKNGETRPVFIAGHVPLHFTARTSSMHTTGDNLYSSLIFDVVNDAAESLDIVYLFGHNHSKGWDCYLGGSCVYKAKGDTILIPRFDETWINTDEYTEETLRFTYLNAGYTGFYMNCAPSEYDAENPATYAAADMTLTGTVFEVYPQRIVVTRYDAEGIHVLGHEGEADPFRGGIDAELIPEATYSKETESPQSIITKN